MSSTNKLRFLDDESLTSNFDDDLASKIIGVLEKLSTKGEDILFESAYKFAQMINELAPKIGPQVQKDLVKLFVEKYQHEK